ncbi:MAG: 50S ribosomal protein L1 [Candidatus Kerfeldbacteria bacterium]|nr:50S ribosomal protein L1 [Candidatus Kerfeldbacteria bacterium]
MRHQGKNYKAAREQIERGKEYPMAEAVALVKKTSTVKFDASVELHIRLGIDPKRAEQIVRTSVVMPHSTGKKRIIAAFTTPAHEKEAKAAGADIVGGEELVKEIKKTGKCDFDVAVATPDFMKQLAPVARILGQKGLMPNPKNETVTTNLQKTITELQGGKLTLRSDDSGNVHALIGKVSLPDGSLAANIETVVGAIKKARPGEQKGTYLRSVTLASAMGPGIRLKV